MQQPAKKMAPSSEEDRKRREAARKRLAEARKALAHRNQVEQDVASPSDSLTIKCSPSNFVTDNSSNPTKEDAICHVKDEAPNSSTGKRPDSIVDAISCAVTINQVNAADNSSLSSISSTSMVHWLAKLRKFYSEFCMILGIGSKMVQLLQGIQWYNQSAVLVTWNNVFQYCYLSFSAVSHVLCILCFFFISTDQNF